MTTKTLTISPEEREQILDLEDDQTAWLADGSGIRLRIESDDTDPFEDSDYYGKVAPVGSLYDSEGMRRERPAGFTGNAEKVWAVQNGDCYWWEPPVEGPKRGTEDFDRFRWAVRELLAFGYVGFVLELLDGTDAYGRPIIRNAASLWGVEWNVEDTYKREILGELLSELVES